MNTIWQFSLPIELYNLQKTIASSKNNSIFKNPLENKVELLKSTLISKITFENLWV